MTKDARFIEGSKVVEKENIGEHHPPEALEEAANRRIHMLEGLAKVFMDHFGYTPDQVEMVEAHEESDGRHKIFWYFRKKVDQEVKDSVSLWTPSGEKPAVRTFEE
jgi:hypothetical protein